MAKKSMIIKQQRTPKFKVRKYNRCNRCKICGRPRAYMRHFGMCRLCFRKYAAEGAIPGITRSSW